MGSAAVGEESAAAGARLLTSSPEPLGRWSSTFGSNRTFPQMGMRYRVIREFKDDDAQVHPVGEEWTAPRGMYPDIPLERALPWLLIFFGPLALTSAYLWAADRYGFANWNADLTAMAVSVLAGVVMLRRKVRADRTLWTILYVPATAVAVFIWAIIFSLR